MLQVEKRKKRGRSPHRTLWIILAVLLLLLPAAALGEVVFSEVMAQNGVWQNGHAYDWVDLRS